jgi:hypothetical protein
MVWRHQWSTRLVAVSEVTRSLIQYHDRQLMARSLAASLANESCTCFEKTLFSSVLPLNLRRAAGAAPSKTAGISQVELIVR